MASKQKAKQSGRVASTASAAKRAPAAAAKSALAGSSIGVPRANVGAACQAAISFQNAVTVTATASDADATTFTVAWS